jgi:hypothetical protein
VPLVIAALITGDSKDMVALTAFVSSLKMASVASPGAIENTAQQVIVRCIYIDFVSMAKPEP